MYEMLHKTANVAQGHIRGFVPIGSRHEAKDIGLLQKLVASIQRIQKSARRGDIQQNMERSTE